MLPRSAAWPVGRLAQATLRFSSAVLYHRELQNFGICAIMYAWTKHKRLKSSPPPSVVPTQAPRSCLPAQATWFRTSWTKGPKGRPTTAGSAPPSPVALKTRNSLPSLSTMCDGRGTVPNPLTFPPIHPIFRIWTQTTFLPTFRTATKSATGSSLRKGKPTPWSSPLWNRSKRTCCVRQQSVRRSVRDACLQVSGGTGTSAIATDAVYPL